MKCLYVFPQPQQQHKINMEVRDANKLYVDGARSDREEQVGVMDGAGQVSVGDANDLT